jgi:hypothetical protein
VVHCDACKTPFGLGKAPERYAVAVRQEATAFEPRFLDNPVFVAEHLDLCSACRDLLTVRLRATVHELLNPPVSHGQQARLPSQSKE